MLATLPLLFFATAAPELPLLPNAPDDVLYAMPVGPGSARGPADAEGRRSMALWIRFDQRLEDAETTRDAWAVWVGLELGLDGWIRASPRSPRMPPEEHRRLARCRELASSAPDEPLGRRRRKAQWGALDCSGVER